VIGGMLTATAIAIFYVPMFFVMVRMIFKNRHADPDPETSAHGGTPAPEPAE
jgi:multidrug efflux pump